MAEAWLGDSDAIALLKERVKDDRMPLLNLLSADPLEVQASHLSFQEYYVARAICERVHRLPKGAQPWEFGSWWRNTMKLGVEMGKDFGRGLLQAADIDGKHLDLCAFAIRLPILELLSIAALAAALATLLIVR